MNHATAPCLAIAAALLTHLAISLDAHAQRVRKAPDVWVQSCVSCHGSTGGNGSASSLLNDAWTVGNGSDADIFRAIHDGVPDAGMEAFGPTLSDAEIQGLVVYIKELRSQHQRGLSEVGQGESSFTGRKTYTSQHHDFVVEPVAQGLDLLWSMTALPNGDWLIVERDGDLRLARPNANGNPRVHPRPIEGTPKVRAVGQGGLLDIALHPDYADNGWVYLSFSEPRRIEGDERTMTTVIRGRIDNHRWVDQEVIFRADDEHFGGARHHYGSRLAFGPDGMLYFTVGDRAQRHRAQNLDHPYAKVHRVHPDGSVPDDNPFLDTPGALPTVWSYGHRNAQGLDFHPDNGTLWLSEHGPRGGDEINFVEKGKNYGWAHITYGINYNGTPITHLTEAPGMEQPAVYYTPSPALIGIDHYTGDRFPQWENDLFVSAIASGQLRRLRTTSDGEVVEDELLFQDQGRLRDVYNAPDGYLYVLTSEGNILRIAPTD
ncbi:MAG: PQQ-dependent sugar dehydrogenase [Planctomycetota bacterium]